MAFGLRTRCAGGRWFTCGAVVALSTALVCCHELWPYHSSRATGPPDAQAGDTPAGDTTKATPADDGSLDDGSLDDASLPADGPRPRPDYRPPPRSDFTLITPGGDSAVPLADAAHDGPAKEDAAGGISDAGFVSPDGQIGTGSDGGNKVCGGKPCNGLCCCQTCVPVGNECLDVSCL